MITKEQYGLWKHEPVTKWFLSVLQAKRDRMVAIATEQWLAGVNLERDVIRGQVIQLDELLTVEFESLQAFFEEEYGIEREKT